MAPRRRCPTCGSRHWHKEPFSGLIACSEGHVLLNYRNEATEVDELGNYALRKRDIKSTRKRNEAKSEANPSLYHGARGRYHYFECLQLILRKQVATLVRLWDLPPEFEVVCRDIWALHLDLLPDPPTAEPYHYSQELRDEEGGHKTTQADANKSDESDDSDAKHPYENDADNKGKEGSEDPELVALLRANSDIEDSSDGGDESPQPGKRKHHRRHGRLGQVYESPASTIAVLIVGCWTLRVPVLCRDFTKLIESYELPYLDPIQRQLLPRSMVTHLTKHNVQALSPFHAPSSQALHGLASRLSKMMYTSYGIFTPEANAAPILWRVVWQGLGGTPMLYKLTKRMGQILSLPLTLNQTLAPGLEKRRTYDPERHVYDSVAPEVSLMGAAMIVLKMVYGLDGRTRTPVDGSDVACGLGRADGYLIKLGKLEAEEEDKGVFDSRIDVSMGDADSEMMDAYLEFSKRVLIGDGDVRPVLDRFFPVSVLVGHEAKSSGAASERNEAIVAEDDWDGLRPGEGYRIYRARDVDGCMGEDWGAVVRRGAQWTGVSVEALGAVVETLERRLARWSRDLT